MTLRPPSSAVSEVTDPDELRRARKRDGQFDRNLAWFRPRAAEVYAAHRGKHVFRWTGKRDKETVDVVVYAVAAPTP